jgi:methyl-accepting chemotaxis protein
LAKERAGIERAVGTGALAKGRFTVDSKNYFIKLISEQGAYLHNFRYFAPKKILEKFEQLKNDPDVMSVAVMEKEMQKSMDLALLNIAPEYWFDTITNKINRYKEVEDAHSSQIIKTADMLYKKSYHYLIMFFIVNSLLFLTIGYLVYMMSKRLTAKVEKFQNGLKLFLSYVAKEKDYIKPLEINGDDEFANMTKMLNTQIERISEIIEQDKKVVLQIDKILNRVNNGFFNNVVENKGASSEIEHLRVSLNKMLFSTKEKFDTLIQLLNHYGEGKFDYEIPHDKLEGLNGDFGAVVTSAKLLGENMSELFAVIQNAGGVLNQNTNNLSDASKRLNSSADEQEKALKHTINALKNMKENSNQSIKDIRTSASMADSLGKSSIEGLNLASKTAKATESINEKVDAIAEAIEIIDDIAFQTNILSLNAAVEAATAGEVGKGFAVVAQEVRNLAAKSADAANEIKELVEMAKEKSIEGKSISEDMIKGYNNLQEDILKTKDMIEGVEKRSKILEDSMKQIDSAVDEMNGVINKNIQIASNITGLSNDIDHLSNDLLQVALHASYKDEVKSQVCDVNLNETIAKMKSKHLLFKTNILSKLDTKERFDVTPPTHCDLGRWMSEQERNGEEFTKSRAWERLIKDHKHIHATAQEFVDKNASDVPTSELDEVATRLERATTTIFKALDGVKREYCQVKRTKKAKNERLKAEA